MKLMFLCQSLCRQRARTRVVMVYHLLRALDRCDLSRTKIPTRHRVPVHLSPGAHLRFACWYAEISRMPDRAVKLRTIVVFPLRYAEVAVSVYFECSTFNSSIIDQSGQRPMYSLCSHLPFFYASQLTRAVAGLLLYTHKRANLRQISVAAVLIV